MIAVVIAFALMRHASLRGQATSVTNGVTAGELVVEPPTLINLGFEWYIQGDANRNATVTVSFRTAEHSGVITLEARPGVEP